MGTGLFDPTSSLLNTLLTSPSPALEGNEEVGLFLELAKGWQGKDECEAM